MGGITEYIEHFDITLHFETNAGLKMDAMFNPMDLKAMHDKLGISPLQAIFDRVTSDFVKELGSMFILKVNFTIIKKKYREPKFLETIASDNFQNVYKNLIFLLLDNIRYTTLSKLEKMQLTHYLTSLTL